MITRYRGRPRTAAAGCRNAAASILAIMALATVTAACSAGSPGSAPPARPKPSAPAATTTTGTTGLSAAQGFEFAGTISITGAAMLTTAFTQPHPAVAGGDVSAQSDPQTCAKAAAVGDANFGFGASGDTWQVPNRISDLTAPATVNVTLNSKQWRGPGSYGVSALLGTSGIRVHNATYYDMSSARVATLTVRPDGSGLLVFQGAPVSGQSSPTISGSVTWTCVNHGG